MMSKSLTSSSSSSHNDIRMVSPSSPIVADISVDVSAKESFNFRSSSLQFPHDTYLCYLHTYNNNIQSKFNVLQIISDKKIAGTRTFLWFSSEVSFQAL